MANKVTIDVGLDDKTQAGNASVLAGAEQVKQTLDQKHQAMLERHRALEEQFARDNAAIFVDIEHEKYAKTAEAFRQLQERNRKEAERHLEDATRPLTPGQAQAGEAARAILAQQPAPVIQKIVNDIEQAPPISPPAPIVQRVVNDVDPPPITQAVNVKPIGENDIAKGARFAQAAMDDLRTRTESLMTAFRELNQSGLQNIGAGGLERLKTIANELRDLRTGANQTSALLREMGDAPGGQPLKGFADAVDHEVAKSVQAIGHFERAATQAETQQQQAAQKTASVIETVRAQQSAAGDRAAEATARAFVEQEQAAEKAEQQFEQTSLALRDIGEAAQKSAAESQRLWNEAKEAQRYTDELRRVADALEKTGNESEETQQQIAQLRAEAMKIGQSIPAMERQALAHENAARSAAQQGDALAHTARAEGVAKEQADRLAQSNQQLTKSFDAAAIARHRSELMQTGVAMKDAQRGGAGAAQAMLQLGYAVDDVQYGMRGIVNNIPMLVQSMGGGAGVAGTLAIVGVLANQVANHWDELSEAAKRSGSVAKAAAEWWKILTSDAKDYATLGLGGVEYAVDSVSQAIENSSSLFGKWGSNADGSASMVKKALYAILDPTGQILDATKKTTEADMQGAEKGLAKREAMAVAKKHHAAQEKEAAQVAAQIHAQEAKSLGEVQAKLAALHGEQLKAEIGNLTPQEKANNKARLDQVALEINAFTARENDLKKASKERLSENAKLSEEAINKSADQQTEIAKQTALTRALHEIELKRASIATGADNVLDESARVASETRREEFVDSMRRKTEQAKQASDKAAADETLTDTQKAAKRAAYTAATLVQIGAEAQAKQQKAEDVAAFEQLQAQKMAAIDREAVAVREAELVRAREAEEKAIAISEAAIRDGGNQADVAHQKAKADRDKATAERIKAEGDLAKQKAANETRIHDTETRNDDARTKQRIADEAAIGKAREKALIDAAQREQEIEDAKNAKRKDALQAEPRIQEAAKQIQQRIDPREVERIAIRRRQDAAENQLRAERIEAGEAIKPGEVAQARREAGREFIQDRNAGKAKAELAGVADELFAGAVDNTRGLADPIREALKAISRDAAKKLLDAANIDADVAKVGKQAPGDEAARKRGRTREEVEAGKLEELNARRKEKGLPAIKADQKPPPVDPRDAEEPEQVKTPAEILAAAKTKAAEQKKAHDELTAKRDATRKAAEDKKRRAEERHQFEVDQNVSRVEEKRRLENETPEERAAREQKEDEEFRARRAKEEDERIAAEHARQLGEQKAQRKPRMGGVKDWLREHPDFADGPIQEHEEPQFFHEPSPAKSPPVTPDLAKPQSPPVTPALDAVTKAAKQLGEQQAKSDSEIVDALNKVASLLTDQANRQEQLKDVVAQVTEHVNGLQSQIVAQSQSNTRRALSAGAV